MTPKTQETETPSSLSLGFAQPLQAWRGVIRSRAFSLFYRLFVRFLLISTFLASSYFMGWTERDQESLGWLLSRLMIFPLLGLGLWLYARQIHMPPQLLRWIMLVPFGFFVDTLRHLAAWWITAMAFLVLGIGSLLFHARFDQALNRAQRLRQTALDLGLLLVILSQLFLPRKIFAALMAFLPLVALIVFYNFILERDRLMRAKALELRDPPRWLIRANRLIPSSTYLFLLLPAFLFAEAILFQAFDQTFQNERTLQTHRRKKRYRSANIANNTPHRPTTNNTPHRPTTNNASTKNISPTTHPVTASHLSDRLLRPSLVDWLRFTVTGQIHARDARTKKRVYSPSTGQAEYLALGAGYTLVGSLLRALLIFFYAKRLLLIYLLLMDSFLGIRVNREAVDANVPNATHPLKQHQDSIQRTVDSYPRIWAAFLVRGVKGNHALLDPIAGLLWFFQWMRARFLPRVLPFLKPATMPPEERWSRILREEQIKIIGNMQDRAWALEALISLAAPPLRTDRWRRVYSFRNWPWIGPWVRWIFTPPEDAVRARLIAEMALVVERAVRYGEHNVALSDIETELLTSEQIWQLRNRALSVFQTLLQESSPILRTASARAILSIAQLQRPTFAEDIHIWRAATQAIFLALQNHHPSETSNTSPFSSNAEMTTLPIAPLPSPSALSTSDADLSSTTHPNPPPNDPFASFAQTSPQEEAQILLDALGHIGIDIAIQELANLRIADPSLSSAILRAMGYADQASGHPNAGLPHAESILHSICQDPHNPEIPTALASLVRLGFPWPVARLFQEATQQQQALEQIQRSLTHLAQELETLEQRAKQAPLYGDVLQTQRDIYRQHRQQLQHAEDLILRILQTVHDTFWNLQHINAMILIAAYLEGEGFERTPEYTDALEKLSLEDPQGWKEFFAQLPTLEDPNSWIAPFHRFAQWTITQQPASNPEEPPQASPLQLFLEMKETLRPEALGHDLTQRQQRLQDLLARYNHALRSVLLRYQDCMAARPTFFFRFAHDAPPHDASLPLREEWWQITLSGVTPWIQPLHDAPSHLEANRLYLVYEQFTPLRLSPAVQLTWIPSPQPERLVHGHLPKLLWWAYNLNRTPQLHLRALGQSDNRDYWQSPLSLTDSLEWETQLAHLREMQESRTLEGIDFLFLEKRSRASFRQVFARSRLREQEALIVERDDAKKLNNFLENERIDAPNIFLLAGEAGMGHTLLLLQHARQQVRANRDRKLLEKRYTFFLDVGLLATHHNLATWLYHELQLQSSPEEEQQQQKRPEQALLKLFKQLRALFDPDHHAQRKIDEDRPQFCLYIDGFHDASQHGILRFAEAIQLAQKLHRSHPWFRLFLSIRRSFLEHHLQDPCMRAFLRDGNFQPPQELFYRERSGLHGVLQSLPPFRDEGPTDRPELVRAYQRFYNYTDTSGTPRYRPERADIRELERFGMTRSILAHPSLLPVVMETYHRKELKDDIHITDLFDLYMERFHDGERDFFSILIRRMLYGNHDIHHPPHQWTSQALLPETTLLSEAAFAPFLDSFKYGTAVYDDLRARGILLRQWRTPHDRPLRTVGFASLQLQEYLVFQELWQHKIDWNNLSPVDWQTVHEHKSTEYAERVHGIHGKKAEKEEKEEKEEMMFVGAVRERPDGSGNTEAEDIFVGARPDGSGNTEAEDIFVGTRPDGSGNTEAEDIFVGVRPDGSGNTDTEDVFVGTRPDGSGDTETESGFTIQSDPVGWLLEVADHSDHFRPLEGALALILLRLIEEHAFQAVADFNDRSTRLGQRNRYILFRALQNLDVRALTRPNGVLDVILKEISRGDLTLLQELGQALGRRGQYLEVDALFGLLLDRPAYAEQLVAFPQEMTELLLARADNKRKLLAQESGGRLSQRAYEEGRSVYLSALQRIQEQTNDPAQQAVVLRFLGLYELDTNHPEEAALSLSRAWSLLQESETAEQIEERSPHRAWIRHLQSSLKRRTFETQSTSLSTEQQRALLLEARHLAEDALYRLTSHRSNEQTELLAQAHDNRARILVGLASLDDNDNARLEQLQQAAESFQGSIQAKRALNDFLGMAMSFSGLGAAHLQRAKLLAQDDIPDATEWNAAKEHFQQALAINRDRLQSGFGMALGYQSLADLHLMHPAYQGTGISDLTDALLAFARIGATGPCRTIIQRLVKEIATLPLQDTRRLLTALIDQIQRIHEISDWLLQTLWEEFSSTLGDKLPRALRDLFKGFFS